MHYLGKSFIIILLTTSVVAVHTCYRKENPSDVIKSKKLNSATIFNDNEEIADHRAKEATVTDDDSCSSRINYIRETISGFIELSDDQIYDDSFLMALSRSNKPPQRCFYPNNKSDFEQLYSLGDSALLEENKNDYRYMSLIINIYLTYFNSPEIVEYFGFKVIPKAASLNIASFIKVLSKKTEQEATKCIEVLQIIDDKTKIEQIKEEMKKLDSDYQDLIKRINNIFDT